MIELIEFDVDQWHCIERAGCSMEFNGQSGIVYFLECLQISSRGLFPFNLIPSHSTEFSLGFNMNQLVLNNVPELQQSALGVLSVGC